MICKLTHKRIAGILWNHVKPYFLYGVLYYLMLFLPDVVTMASTKFELLR